MNFSRLTPEELASAVIKYGQVPVYDLIDQVAQLFNHALSSNLGHPDVVSDLFLAENFKQHGGTIHQNFSALDILFYESQWILDFARIFGLPLVDVPVIRQRIYRILRILNSVSDPAIDFETEMDQVLANLYLLKGGISNKTYTTSQILQAGSDALMLFSQLFNLPIDLPNFRIRLIRILRKLDMISENVSPLKPGSPLSNIIRSASPSAGKQSESMLSPIAVSPSPINIPAITQQSSNIESPLVSISSMSSMSSTRKIGTESPTRTLSILSIPPISKPVGGKIPSSPISIPFSSKRTNPESPATSVNLRIPEVSKEISPILLQQHVLKPPSPRYSEVLPAIRPPSPKFPEPLSVIRPSSPKLSEEKILKPSSFGKGSPIRISPPTGEPAFSGKSSPNLSLRVPSSPRLESEKISTIRMAGTGLILPSVLPVSLSAAHPTLTLVSERGENLSSLSHEENLPRGLQIPTLSSERQSPKLVEPKLTESKLTESKLTEPKLTEPGLSPNQKLLLAVSQSNNSEIQSLIDQGATNYNQALLEAVSKNQIGNVKYFIEKYYGEGKPITYPILSQAAKVAGTNGNSEIIDYLISVDPLLGYLAIEGLGKGGHFDLLKEFPADSNRRGRFLVGAIDSDSPGTVQKIIDEGVSLEFLNKSLIESARQGKLDYVRKLLAAGAKSRSEARQEALLNGHQEIAAELA